MFMVADERYEELKRMLIARQRHEDLEFTLLQMKAETLNKINEALLRLDEGRYGYCFQCGDEIAGPSLRALPFAVRCKTCEEPSDMPDVRHDLMLRQLAEPPCDKACQGDESSGHRVGRAG